MFLNLLGKEEKELVLDLLFSAANIDGDFDERERIVISAYGAEMGIAQENIKQSNKSIDDILTQLSKSSELVKKIVALEIIALIGVDGTYKESEKKLLKNITKKFSLKKAYEEKALNWVNRITPLYKEGYELVGLTK